MDFEEIIPNIYRLRVPFENIYTAVWAICDGQDCVVLDAADTPQDAEEVILPSLKRAGFLPTKLVLSHHHRDHSGGMQALARAFSEAEILVAEPKHYSAELQGRMKRLSDGTKISNHLSAILLPGHTDDSVALLDRRSQSVLTGDCLQLYGVGRWGMGVTDPFAYKASVQRLQQMNLQNVLTAHDYFPLGFFAHGEGEVQAYLSCCLTSLQEVIKFVKQPGSAEEISDKYAATFFHHPPISAHLVRLLKEKA